MNYQMTSSIVEDFVPASNYSSKQRGVNLINLEYFKTNVDSYLLHLNNVIVELQKNIGLLDNKVESSRQFYIWLATAHPQVIDAFEVFQKLEKANEERV